MKGNVFGIDVAKNVFHVVEINRAGKMVSRKKLKRKKFLEYFHQQEPASLAMEACGSAHHWARELQKLGHSVKLLPTLAVKPYVQGSKNDYNDALAIAEASGRPKVQAVRIRTVEEQSIQALQRFRSQAVDQRTAQSNQIRGLLGEYGVVIPKGLSAVRRRLPEILEDGENELPEFFRESLAYAYQRLVQLDQDIDYYQRRLVQLVQQNEEAKRLMTIPGIGPVVAASFLSVIGDGKQFRRGRDVSAFLGLVPRQHSTGDNPLLLGITKRGNKTLRSLLVHGARSVVSHASKKSDRLSRWIVEVEQRRGRNKAIVALANKLARIAWAVLTKNEFYREVTA